MRFPGALVEPGTPPPPNPRKDKSGAPVPCRDCGLPYELHSGDLCLICRAPVEHHDDERLAQEIAACARLSEARLAGGHELRPHERWCLDQPAADAA